MLKMSCALYGGDSRVGRRLTAALLGGVQVPVQARGSVAAHRTFEPEIFAQCLALIFGTEQPAALQLGHDQLHEVLAPARQMRWCNVEAVAGAVLEPLLHGVGDVRRRTDLCRSGNTG